MKREDFHDLAKLLRAWLRAAKDENASGKLEHSRLKKWVDDHRQVEVEELSDDCAILMGSRSDSADLPIEGFLFPEMRRFTTAIAALDATARHLTQFSFDEALQLVGGTLLPQYGIATRREIRSFVFAFSDWLARLISDLGDELKLLEGHGSFAGTPELHPRPKRLPPGKTKETMDAMYDGDWLNMKDTLDDVVNKSLEFVKEFPDYFPVKRNSASEHMKRLFPGWGNRDR